MEICRRLGRATAAIVILAFAACSSDPKGDENPPATPGHETGARSPHQICLSGVRRTPRSNIQVERAAAAPLSAVKAWVLDGSSSIDWATYSSSLATAPLGERVAVCVYSKVDGTSFEIPGTEPAESVVQIVRANGEATLVMVGATGDMLSTTPRTFPSNR